MYHLLLMRINTDNLFTLMLMVLSVYMKGANYIPQHSLQTRVSDKHYEALLNDVVEANEYDSRLGWGHFMKIVYSTICVIKKESLCGKILCMLVLCPGDKLFLKIQRELRINYCGTNHPI